jgi:hypothetical protein
MTRFLIIVLVYISTIYSTPGADILYFNQDCNFDLIGDETCEDERFNLLNIIIAKGHNITSLPDFHQTNLEGLLATHDFLLIPDLEDVGTCDITDPAFINSAEYTLLADYIMEGGKLVITGSSQNVAFLNTAFGLNLMNVSVASSGSSIKNTLQTDGTPLENCPDIIPNVSATFLITASMPASKNCFYSEGDNTSLALFQLGDGSIIYMGYDFFDAGPGCAQERNQWNDCVLDAVIEIAKYGQSGFKSVPTISEWGVIILSLSFVILSTTTLKTQMTNRPFRFIS